MKFLKTRLDRDLERKGVRCLATKQDIRKQRFQSSHRQGRQMKDAGSTETTLLASKFYSSRTEATQTG